MGKLILGIGMTVCILALLCVGCAISGFIIMLVWNALGAYFGFKLITFWIGVAISFALSIVGSVFKSTINTN